MWQFQNSESLSLLLVLHSFLMLPSTPLLKHEKTRIYELEDEVKFKHLLQPSKDGFCERIKARY